MRVAAIDCGTNSLRLLVADTPASGPLALTQVHRSMRVVRLGEGIDATGEFSQAALQRTFAGAQEIADILGPLHPDRVRFVATSATRDAGNRDEFMEGIRSRLGVLPEVVSGEEEAKLSFLGATSGLDAGENERLLVVDLGGGSTECVLGDASGVLAARSADMGAVRFTERFLHSDPPAASEVAAAERATLELLAQVGQDVDFSSVERIIGVAGTITTLTAHALDLAAYDSERINGAALPLGIVEAAADEIIAFPKHRIASLPYVHPGRVDVLQAGAIIWRTLLQTVQQATDGRVTHAVTSELDILDGIALELASRES